MGSIWKKLKGLEGRFDQNTLYTYITFSNFKKGEIMCFVCMADYKNDPLKPLKFSNYLF